MKKETFFEAFGDIDERYVKEARDAQRPWKKRRLWVLAACLALVLIGMPLVHRGITQAREDIIIINEPTVLAMADFKLDRETYTDELLETGKAIFERELGVSLDELTKALPEGWRVELLKAFFIAAAPDGSHSRLLDHFALDVDTPDGSSVRISIGGGRNMLINPFLMKDDDDKESRIDGTSVMIYEHGTVKDFAMENEYIATFEQDGVCYDIRMHADSVEELTELLSALIG